MAQPIGMILQQWADLDIFYYVLPFLLIFALVFAILQKIKIAGEENKGIDAVIALAVALLSLQFDKVPLFFQAIMPNVGIGLSVILAVMIFVGFFSSNENKKVTNWVLLCVGGLVALVVLLFSFDEYTWWTGSFWQDNISAIVAGLIILGAIVAVVASGKSSSGGSR